MAGWKVAAGSTVAPDARSTVASRFARAADSGTRSFIRRIPSWRCVPQQFSAADCDELPCQRRPLAAHTHQSERCGNVRKFSGGKLGVGRNSADTSILRAGAQLLYGCTDSTRGAVFDGSEVLFGRTPAAR